MDHDLLMDPIMENSSDNNEREGCEQQPVKQENTSPADVTDEPPENGLPEIMASLGLTENTAPSTTKDNSNVDDFAPRRSQRKRSVPLMHGGRIVKRRCLLRPQAVLDRLSNDSCFQESEDTIREFYENYNKTFKRPPTKSLETIYEEPVQKNGTTVFSGPKKRRFLPFPDFVSKAKLKSRQLKIKSMLLNKTFKKNKKRFTIEEVKNHLAESGIFG